MCCGSDFDRSVGKIARVLHDVCKKCLFGACSTFRVFAPSVVGWSGDWVVWLFIARPVRVPV